MNYRDLIVWQNAVNLVTLIYKVTASFPTEERFGLSLQLRRTAISIPSHISEWYAKQTSPACINHLSIAFGALKKLHTQLQIAVNLKFIQKAPALALLMQMNIIGKVLSELITAVRMNQVNIMHTLPDLPELPDLPQLPTAAPDMTPDMTPDVTPLFAPSGASLSIIVAMAKNRTIGVNNTLPWRCTEDLRHFKRLTMGHHIIMGRKTFESIGRILPGRTTVIVTRDRSLTISGCLITHSLPEAMAACANARKVFIVGGAEIYAQAMEYANTLYITEIQQEVAGDTWFPEFDRSKWMEMFREKHYQETPQALEFDFVTYRRADTLRRKARKG